MEDALPSAPPPAASPLSPPAFDRRRVRRWAVVAGGVLLLAYLLLQNPYWVPGGDSDFYVAIARSMARGQGYLYNGLPVALSPPGWPWVMAQVMKVSPTFLTLKLTAMLSMYGSLLIGYFIALRFLKPRVAAWATILAGLLMPVYSLTYFLHSEGLYCLLSAIALLLALRLREGRGGKGHVIALAAASVAIPLVRWAGVFQLLPIVAVLLSGRPGLPMAQRHWKTALACALLILGTFAAAKWSLRLSEQQIKDIQAEGGAAGGDTDTPIDEPPSEVVGDQVFKGKDAKKGVVREYSERVGQSGKWFAWLLWQPSRFVDFSRPMGILVAVAGWGVIGMLGFLAVHEARRGEWLWVSLALYTGGICVGWNNINSRYFVPLAPLIIVGLVLSTRRLSAAFPTRSIDWWKWLRRGLVYSILFCNLAMYGVDVIVMRSSRFYETFEAGQHKDLISAASFLMSLPPPLPTTSPSGERPPDGPAHRLLDTKLLVNQRYDNLGKAKDSKAGTRAMVLLTDRFVKPLDGKVTRTVRPTTTNPKLARIVRQKNAEWYFAQDKITPWRVWHFRLPQWLFARLTKASAAPPSSGWALYRFNRIDGTFTQYPFAPVENWPTRVPGL